MIDDPNQVLKIYGVIDVSAMADTPTEQQWIDLIKQVRTKPLISAILSYLISSQNDFSAHKRARGTSLMKLCMFTFEVDQVDKTTLLSQLNTIASNEGVSGNATQKLQGCLQVELRSTAVDLGYTGTQANKLTVTILNTPGVFNRNNAITVVQQYLADNDLIWHAVA